MQKRELVLAVVSANAGVDRVLSLGAPLRPGEMNRITHTVLRVGSKGANVARFLKSQHGEVRYIATSGGEAGSCCNAFTEELGIPCRFVNTKVGVRVNRKLVSPDGTVTECNEQGGPVTGEECAALLRATVETQADAFLLCGSLPAGAPEAFYGEMLHAIRQAHPAAGTVLDCAGTALRAAMESCPPGLIKPNRGELAELLGEREPESVGEAMALCRRFRARYRETELLCSLGADGAIYMGESGQYLVTHPAVSHPTLTVGAGDTLLGGFLLARTRGYSLPEALRLAAAGALVQIGLPVGVLPLEEEISARLPEIRAQAIEE